MSYISKVLRSINIYGFNKGNLKTSTVPKQMFIYWFPFCIGPRIWIANTTLNQISISQKINIKYLIAN